MLQPADVSSVFTRFDEGRQVRADAPPGARADPERFDRLGGWKSRYRRQGSRATRGPLIIESRADLFGSASGAKEELDAISESEGSTAELNELGDEAVGTIREQGAGAFATRFITLSWRHRNAVGVVSVSGFAGKVTLADAFSLARKQQARMSRAR